MFKGWTIYSRLWLEFGPRPFSVDIAASKLGISKDEAEDIFRLLRSKGLLLEMSLIKGDDKYKLVYPTVYTLLSTRQVRWIRIKQEEYFNLIYLFFPHVYRRVKPLGFAVYGSVARGEANENSDVDILIVSDEFTGSLGKRIEMLLEDIPDVDMEIDILYDMGIYADLSILPLTSEEAFSIPRILFDIPYDGKIIYERDDYLQKLFNEIRKYHEEKGYVRVEDKDNRYWMIV